MLTSVVPWLVASTAIGASAQRTYYETIGLGTPMQEVFRTANQNPLNKTQVTFQGFDFNATPVATGNATSSQQWTWHAGLSIFDTETNKTNYPISAAANTTSNIIDVAYSLEFPGGQLPQQNDTNWTLCSHIVDVPWTSAVLNRAANDPGDCSVVFGSACYNRVLSGWKHGGISNIGCPSAPTFNSFSECDGVTTNGYSIGSGSITSFYSDPNNKSSPSVGLKSGQIFSWESSSSFNASQAQAVYNENASKLRMVVLTMTPSKAFFANYTGAYTSGDARMFCTVMNKQAPRSSAAPRLNVYGAVGTLAAVWTLLFAWGTM